MPTLHHLFQLRQLALLRLITLSAAFLIGCTIFVLYLSNDQTDSIPSAVVGSSAPFNDNINGTCYIDLDSLRAHASNSSKVEYARLEIAVARTNNFTDFPDSLDAPFPKYQSVHLDTEQHREQLPEEKCSTSVTIQAPLASAPPDASHMIFGVATSVERLLESLDPFAYWAAGTNAHIVAVVDSGGTLKKEAEKRATELGLRLTIIEQLDERLDRYFSLVKTLLKLRDESTKWAVLIDDDTFFPSMRNLVDTFARYDATKQQYIGALTEDMWQLYTSGHIAYGGAGVFLSMPLVQQLNDVFDRCYDFKDTGDRMIARCIYAQTSTKLTWERSLSQLDFRGDASGFYESGRPLPLSLHHWKSWSKVDVLALSKVAAVCGEACLLRRWELLDGWYLVNGYSVIKYSNSLRDMDSMEQTWNDSKYPGTDAFGYSLGPLGGRDDEKISLRLHAAIEDGDRVRQLYVDATRDGDARVLEVVWKFE